MRWSGVSARARLGRVAMIAGAALVATLAVTSLWPGADRSSTMSRDLTEFSSDPDSTEATAWPGESSGGTQTVIGTVSAPPPSKADRTAGRSLIDKVVWSLSDSRIVDEGTSIIVPGGRLTTGIIIEARAASEDVGAEHLFSARLSVFKPTAPSAERPYSLQGSWRIEPKGAGSQVRYTATGVKGTLSGEFREPPLEMTRVRLGVLVLGRRALGSRASGEGQYEGSGGFEGTLRIPRVPMPSGD